MTEKDNPYIDAAVDTIVLAKALHDTIYHQNNVNKALEQMVQELQTQVAELSAKVWRLQNK